MLIYIFTLLISQSTNVEANPGPAASQYPCGYCALEVTRSQKGIYCEECGMWYHTDCQGIGDGTYDRLSDSKHIWICINCCLPNYSSPLLESLDSFADKTRFSSLEHDKVQVGKDQEKAQSERDSHPKNRGWKKTKLTIRQPHHETHRKPNEHLLSQQVATQLP